MKSVKIWLDRWVSFLCFLFVLFPAAAFGAGGSWKAVSSGLNTSDILSLAIDSSSQTIYAGTNGGGVFKSTGGGSWTAASSGIDTVQHVVSSIVLDQSSHTLYAGTDQGAFKSTDGGNSWVAASTGLGSTYINSVAIDPGNGQVLYAGSETAGVFKSTDGGGSWSASGNGLVNQKVTSLAVDPANSNVIYAATFGGVCKSLDGGASWALYNSGISVNGISVTSITVIAIDGGGAIYAGTQSSGLFKSTDGGTSWSGINTGVNLNVRTLAVDPNNSQTIYAGTTNGGGVFQSSDAGGSWSGVNNGLASSSKNVKALAINPANGPSVYAGTAAGVFQGLFPYLTGNPATTVISGSSYSFTPIASNAASFSIANLPPWASFNTATGALTGKPADADIGSYPNITISATNSVGTVSLPAFSIAVNRLNHAPTISGTPPASVVEGTPYYFTPAASDPDGDGLTFGITNMPSWAAFDPATGTLSGTPPTAGTFSGISISVNDGALTTVLPSFSINVLSSNHAPVISGSPTLKVLVNTPYSFQPTATDIDGDTLVFSITNKPDWAKLDSVTGKLSGTPNAAGTFGNIIISVSDGKTSVSLRAFTITVALPNNPPTISGTPAVTIPDGSTYSFIPVASDPDGDTLHFAISGKPSWATFNTSTGELSGTATPAGVYGNINIYVSDGSASTSLPTFTITVTVTNNAPTISGTPTTVVRPGTSYSFTPTAADADGDPLTFSIANEPSWASFDPATGTLSGTPPSAGIFAGIAISVTDGKATTALRSFSITVNTPPTISGTPAASVVEGTPYSFTPTGFDPDGDTLTFSGYNIPPWASVDTTTGTLSGTPPAAGFFGSIRIMVSDGKATAYSSYFSITVTSANHAPSISGSPATSVPAGAAYSFIPTASDIDGDTLTFGVTNLPSWATFNTATGELSGTTPSSAGTFSGIKISVTDGVLTSYLPTFSISVLAVNRPPTIDGAPLLFAPAETAYSFTPAASDPDGNSLLFSIANKPSWASFDTNTGTLSGIPVAGTYANIVITVSDRLASASLPAFTIEVNAVNHPPVISGTPSAFVAAGTFYSFTPTAVDPDHNPLTFAVANKPSWASFDIATGRLSGTPTAMGSETGIQISVTDGSETVTLPPFSISIIKAGDCDGSGTVGIAEVQTAINTFLGLKGAAPCVDLDNDGVETISEVQKVINGYLGL